MSEMAALLLFFQDMSRTLPFRLTWVWFERYWARMKRPRKAENKFLEQDGSEFFRLLLLAPWPLTCQTQRCFGDKIALKSCLIRFQMGNFRLFTPDKPTHATFGVISG
jgi:hypothetical protein